MTESVSSMSILADYDFGDIVSLIAVLAFGLLSGLGQMIKKWHERQQKKALQNKDFHEMEPAEVIEDSNLEHQWPAARPAPAKAPAHPPPPPVRIAGGIGPGGKPAARDATARPGTSQPPVAPPVIQTVAEARAILEAIARGGLPRRATAPPPDSAPVAVTVSKAKIDAGPGVREQPARRPDAAAAGSGLPARRPPICPVIRDAQALSPSALRRAIIMAEILAPPVGLRDISGSDRIP
ncbi:MAG: hypothetical protein JXQ75_20725 [Phycisphaerae bacterium]|nr:hypothetical protein [Phycisphaerae bacterium]